MGLIEGLEERLEREYISLHDFLWHISELNDEPIQDICTFLIHHGFENKVRIYLNMPWYHMEESTENNKKSLLDTLMNIESADIVLDEELNEHNRNTEELIGILTSEANYAKIYFEKKELLSLSFLKDLLHFNDIPPLADNDSEQQSPSFLPDPLSYDELLAEKERLVTEIWKLLEQRDTATELLKTEQQEKNLLKEENAQLHAKIAELSAQHGNIRQQNRATPEADNIPSERTEKGYLTTIGILLDMMTIPKWIDSRPPFPSQAKIIEEIAERKIYGQGKSTLEKRFSDANDQLSEINKSK